MEYYTAVNNYPAFGFTAPWYWRVTSATYNQATGHTHVTTDVGYEDPVYSDNAYIPGVWSVENAPEALMSHIVPYQNSTGPIGVGGGGFPKR